MGSGQEIRGDQAGCGAGVVFSGALVVTAPCSGRPFDSGRFWAGFESRHAPSTCELGVIVI